MGVGVSVVLPSEQPLGLSLNLGDDFRCEFDKCQTRTHRRPLPLGLGT
ncbi:hypothetical protein L195_g063705, partial [Trifolium pratense]